MCVWICIYIYICLYMCMYMYMSMYMFMYLYTYIVYVYVYEYVYVYVYEYVYEYVFEYVYVYVYLQERVRLVMLQPSPKHYDDHTPSGIHIQVQNLWDYLRLLGWNGLSPTMRLLCIRMMRCIGLS